MRKGIGCLIAAALVFVGARGQDAAQPDWADPEFKKAFLGSYGVHPDVEPRIGPEDKVLLEKAYPLLGSDPDGAARIIHAGRKPDSSAIFDFVLGNLAMQADRVEEAEKYYQEAVRKFPSYRRAWRNLGLIQARSQRYDEAIAAFTRMIELGGGDAISLGLLGNAYLARQDYIAAEAAFRQALLLEPANAQWRIGLARCVVKQEKYEEAASLLQVLLDKDPERTEFWLLQANAFIGMKQPLRAAENLEMLLLLGRATPESTALLGDIYLQEEQIDMAVRAYLQGIEHDPAQPAGRVLKAAEVLASRGAMAEAKLLAQAIRGSLSNQLEPEEAVRLAKMEARIAVSEGQGDQAVKLLEEVVALDPLDGEALLLIAQHYADGGDPERALIYLERAAGLDKHEAQARLRQAQVLVSQEKYDEALPLLKRAQEIKPREQVARYMEQVERLARSNR